MCTIIMFYYSRNIGAVFKQVNKNNLHNNMHVCKYGAGTWVGLIKRRNCYDVTFEIGDLVRKWVDEYWTR